LGSWRTWVVGGLGWLADLGGWRTWVVGGLGWLADLGGWRTWVVGAGDMCWGQVRCVSVQVTCAGGR
ncbi:hypothetical protein CLOM_g9689, partial [Closterium sp. NIES-68]